MLQPNLSMKIVEVNNKRAFKQFLKVPDVIHYNTDKYISSLKLNTIAALDKKKNPLWLKGHYRLFIAYQNNKLIGRIAAIYSQSHDQVYDDQTCYFGYFDCINDINVASTLLKTASDFALQNKCKNLIGPINPTTNYELGILTKGFNEKPYFMMNYNPPYYQELIEKLSGKEAMIFRAYSVPVNLDDNKIRRVSNLIRSRYNIAIDEINYNRLSDEAKNLCQIYNDAFTGHWGAIPFLEEEFTYVVLNMKLLMDKRLIFKVRYNGEIAGFIMALPNWNEVVEKLKNGKLGLVGMLKFLYYKNKIQWVKVTVVAIRKKYQHLGLGSVLYTEILDRVKEAGYKGAELSWVASSNHAMNKAILSMNAQERKQYKVYQFKIQDMAKEI